jgi:hypothetical protein
VTFTDKNLVKEYQDGVSNDIRDSSYVTVPMICTSRSSFVFYLGLFFIITMMYNQIQYHEDPTVDTLVPRVSFRSIHFVIV